MPRSLHMLLHSICTLVMCVVLFYLSVDEGMGLREWCNWVDRKNDKADRTHKIEIRTRSNHKNKSPHRIQVLGSSFSELQLHPSCSHHFLVLDISISCSTIKCAYLPAIHVFQPEDYICQNER